MRYITIGLGDIDENGILKKESGRGARALQYQFFGAVPLVASATLAAKNGVDLYQVNHGALVRLVHMLLQNVDDNASFKSKTGIQELEPFRDGKVPQTHMGWLA